MGDWDAPEPKTDKEYIIATYAKVIGLSSRIDEVLVNCDKEDARIAEQEERINTLESYADKTFGAMKWTGILGGIGTLIIGIVKVLQGVKL